MRECIRGTFSVDRDFLTGSYDRHTKTKPLKDVDIFFALATARRNGATSRPMRCSTRFVACLAGQVWQGCRRPRPPLRHGRVREEHQGRGRQGAVDRRRAGVRARTTCYEIPDRVLGKWIKTDPEIHAEKSTAKNKTLDGKWVPLVKMIKRWNRSADGPIKPSFLIEVMAQDLVDAPFTTYPREVQRFFAAVPAVLSGPWADPAGLGPPVSDQMTPDLVTKAISALRQAEKKASLAMRREAEGNTGRGARAVARDHGPLLSNELEPMAHAVVARKHGDDFQARLFWLHAALLLDPRGPVVRVGYEIGPKAFDDVLVEYDPARAPQDHHGQPVLRDHLQTKWHVKPGEFTYADLTDPAFTNATSQSFCSAPGTPRCNTPPTAPAPASSWSRTGG